MSSSNQVRVAFIEESAYGETPVAGDFQTARFTSETLSGTPETTESQQIRTDRMSSGQVTTGLTLAGDLNIELAKEDAIDDFFESAMYNVWQTPAAVTIDLTIDNTAKTLDRTGGDFNIDVRIGDFLTLTGFAASGNNVQVQVASIVSATQIKYIGPTGMSDETGSGTTFKVADYIEIGTTKKSFSMEKAFLDLTDKAINYKGMIASGFSLSVAYGSLITGAFNFSGNDYSPVDAAGDFITDGRTITPPATSQTFNGSVDMPIIANDATGVFQEAGFCIQSVDINLNNNLTAQTCIGFTAPQDYSEGTAAIENSISAYLSDGNWSFLSKKLSQEPFALGFQLKNSGGFYGFYIPALQVSFDDPAGAGINQDVILSMSGTAKVAADGGSALRIYRS